MNEGGVLERGMGDCTGASTRFRGSLRVFTQNAKSENEPQCTLLEKREKRRKETAKRTTSSHLCPRYLIAHIYLTIKGRGGISEISIAGRD
mmetsp:Transcript_3329/g.6292  ORF Transcript_3329/g.6292 Transcript_3329/m.6292 type:complete len:91 (-) Transcript_3329:1453-1725(-)